jgi:hypothetical protein
MERTWGREEIGKCVKKSTNSNVIALTLVNNADGSGNIDGKNYTFSVRLIGLLLFHSNPVV